VNKDSDKEGVTRNTKKWSKAFTYSDKSLVRARRRAELFPEGDFSRQYGDYDESVYGPKLDMT
jgi:hypothetical protein